MHTMSIFMNTVSINAQSLLTDTFLEADIVNVPYCAFVTGPEWV